MVLMGVKKVASDNAVQVPPVNRLLAIKPAILGQCYKRGEDRSRSPKRERLCFIKRRKSS
jgi:hypothetical protein